MILLKLLAQTALASTVPVEPIPPSEETALNTIADDLLREVNKARVAKGLPFLFKWEPLTCAASMQNNYIKLTNRCDHDRINGVRKRLQSCGGTYGEAGEIIACGHVTAKDAVNAWLKSPQHERIMMDPSYNVFGATAYAGSYVVVFGEFKSE
jgi:uncharacterized protein YkwD